MLAWVGPHKEWPRTVKRFMVSARYSRGKKRHPIFPSFSPGRVHPRREGQGQHRPRIPIILSGGHGLRAPQGHGRYHTVEKSGSRNKPQFPTTLHRPFRPPTFPSLLESCAEMTVPRPVICSTLGTACSPPLRALSSAADRMASHWHVLGCRSMDAFHKVSRKSVSMEGSLRRRPSPSPS